MIIKVDHTHDKGTVKVTTKREQEDISAAADNKNPSRNSYFTKPQNFTTK
jgi:hypothetical protein